MSALAPGTAMRRALDTAVAEMEAGRRGAVAGVARPLRADARARAGPLREAAAPRLRHRAAPPSGRRARRDAHRADRRKREAGRERQRATATHPSRSCSTRTTRTRTTCQVELGEENGADEDEATAPHGDDPGAERRYPLPPSDGVRQDDRGRRIRRGRPHRGRADPHPSPPARRPVPARADRARLRPTDSPTSCSGSSPAEAAEPDHDPDLRLVRTPRRRGLADGLPARDLRRGAHRARREDLRRDPQPQRADLHRHDRDRGADREAGLGRLPGLGRRPAAGRRGAARPDRAASLRCACRRSRRSTRCRSSAATSTRARLPPPSTTTR